MKPHGSCGTTRRVQRFFDELADAWDASVCPEHGERLNAILERLAIPPDAVVLDVGCGTGVLLPGLTRNRRGPAKAAAIDLSFNMLRAAAARADVPAGTVACVQADAMILPFADGVFDWVLCNSVFPHFLDQQGCVAELTRVLGLGGRLVVCHSQDRATINAFHHSRGGLIGGHALPEDDVMERMMLNAGVRVLTLEDAPDHYLLIAERAA